METLPTKVELPTVAELYENKDMTIKNSALAVLLNAEPPQHWVKIHPITKFKYIPIEIVEYLLTRIFSKWKVEVLDSKIVANSIAVTIRLHYVDPVTGQMDWMDGVGAAPLQTNAGAGAIDFNQIKSASVMMALPSAESFAVKDAAEKLGKIFGKDLNRKDAQAYDQIMNDTVKRFTKKDERAEAMIKDAQTTDDLNKIEPYVTDNTYDLFNQRKEELNGK